MSQRFLLRWMTAIGIIGVLFGIFYAIFGLGGLPVYRKFVPPASFEGWSRGLYGATFIGFSVVLLFMGRHAIRTHDKQIARILLYGIFSWLIFEAVVSLIYRVYINIAVDLVLMAFLSFPLFKGTRDASEN